jgi:siderophore synthetase component
LLLSRFSASSDSVGLAGCQSAGDEVGLGAERRLAGRPDVYRDTAVGQLLRCWVRERTLAEPEDGTLRLVLAAANVEVHAPVEYWSPVGWHRFGPARFVRPSGARDAGAGADVDTEVSADAVDPGTLAALLAAEVGSPTPDAIVDLITRVADSAANAALFLAQRRANPTDRAGTTPFLSTEQAQITGDPLHPAPKGRDSLRAAPLAAYSPELRGSFQLHWFAADPAIVSADSALPEPVENVMAGLARHHGSSLQVPAGMVPIPAHPWQARELVDRAGIRQLLDDGLLRDLGPAGDPWYPTSSLRTVYRADSPVMLKLSLDLPTANPRREDARAQRRRGVQMHRLLEAGLGAELAEAHPGFAIVRDPAWLAVDSGGLDVVLRENPFGPRELVHCVAGLVAERPGAGPSLLACLIRGLAARSRRPISEVAREWFGRYLATVAAPVIWLYAEHGIALAAHQQNTLVVVNGGGWPVGGRYRADQGHYFAASRAGALARWSSGAGRYDDPAAGDAIVDERFGYHLGVNNLMGLIGAFGSQSMADERVLLADLRRVLREFAAHGQHVPDAVHALLDRDTLRYEAPLLTLISGLDEPVHVQMQNPLSAAEASSCALSPHVRVEAQ